MAPSDSSQSGSENVALPAQTSIGIAAEMTALDSTELPPFGVEEVPGHRFLSVPLNAFYDKLPKQLLTSKRPDLARLVYIAPDDVVSDEETGQATILLSILSLSCPEIFAHPVQSEDDTTVTFPLSQPESQQLERPSADFGPGRGTQGAGVIGTPESAAKSIESEAKGASASADVEIRLNLEPILANLPLEFELPPICKDLQTEIALPAHLVKDQLKNGRVSIAVAAFCALLPEHLKHLFEKVDPTGEITIPLREIFPKLPSDAVKLREDFELGYSQAAIQTPFTATAEEDAVRNGDLRAALKTDADAQGVPLLAPKTDHMGTAAETEPAPAAELTFPDTFDSHELQALFMTEEELNLTRTIQKVSELPGLLSCLLTTANGRKLAGKWVDFQNETALSLTLPLLSQQVASALAELQFHSLEGVTFYSGQDSLSIFPANRLFLAVLHDNRPFRPGVREKIVAILQELERIGQTTRQSGQTNASD
jgi:hypothetical protein